MIGYKGQGITLWFHLIMLKPSNYISLYWLMILLRLS